GKSTYYQYSMNDFTVKEMWYSARRARKVALQNAKKRVNYIICLHKMITPKNRREVRLGLRGYYQVFWATMENYNRWLYSLEKTSLLRPYDRNEISKFYKSKYELYKLMQNRTEEWIFREDIIANKKELKKDIQNIYLSLYKLHYEFYYNINPQLRKKILSSQRNLPKGSGG
ncbi:MAG: hypothetical protein AAF518_05450, partial [Spirochaetota bacterium]